MMIIKFALVCALVAAPALAKGLPARSEEPAKELEKTSQREELSKTSQRAVEQVEQVEAREQQREDLSQIKEEEFVQVKEEIPAAIKGEPLRYDAKPQVSRDELAKGQAPKGYSELPQREEQLQLQQQEQVEIKQQQEEYLEQAPLIRPLQQQTPVAGEPEPYAFSYQVEGSSRSESGDTKGVVRGQYTLQGADGANRVVDYIADHNGFRASVNTNEFGTENRSPAAVNLRTSQPSAESITRGLEPVVLAAASATKTRVEEAPRITQVLYPAETKGAAPAAPALAPAPAVPAPLEKARPVAEERKGGQQLEQPQQQQQEWTHAAQEPVKSAPLRAPKAIAASKQLARVSGFQSATAAYRAPALVPAVRPVQLLRAQQPTVVRGPVAVRAPVSQGYRPVLVQPAYRRPVARELNPRVSFYGSEDEHLGFLEA